MLSLRTIRQASKPLIHASAAFALFLVMLTGSAVAEPAQITAGKKGFDESVQPFLARYCIDCHGPDAQEGDLALHALQFNDFARQDVDRWNKVGEMLAFDKMPPDDATQPEAAERAALLAWLEGQLRAAGREPDWKHKLPLPDYGNLVSHEVLFARKAPDAPFTPSRLWKKSPDIFAAHLKRGMGLDVGKNRKPSDQLKNVKQPFTMEDRAGIKDFAAVMLADSSTLDTMLRNAEVIVDKHLEKAMAELDARTAEPPADGQAQPRPAIHVQTPEEFREIILSSEPPTDNAVDAAVRKMYACVIEWQPSQPELIKYRGLFRELSAKGGNAEGLRMTFIAIAVSPEAVYRQELGAGPVDEHGRQMLNPANLAFALSYALTDNNPDEALLQAAQSGRLNTRADAAREAARMWDDESLAKPRILRFFQEFFGYAAAPQVFKDDSRFGSPYNGNAKVAERLVADADTLVLHIVQQDRNVLAELLTTEQYFVAHDGDNERSQAVADAQAAFYEYLKDKDWKDWPYNIPKEHAANLRELDRMYSHVNGSIVKHRMGYLSECDQLGIQPMPATLRREFLAAYNLDEKTFDYPVEQPFALAPGKRAGILLHPAWLIAYSLNLENDPIRRGKWVRERLLADLVPELPITVDASIPDEPDQTLRHRFRVTREAECWRCHVQMNPLGMPFEAFDDFGKFREVEQLHAKGMTAPVDSSGALVGTRDKSLDGPVEHPIELVHRLAKSERVRQSFVRHAFRYWMGRNELPSDAATLQAADQAYVESGGSFRALVLSLLASDSFLYRKPIGTEHE